MKKLLLILLFCLSTSLFATNIVNETNGYHADPWNAWSIDIHDLKLHGSIGKSDEVDYYKFKFDTNTSTIFTLTSEKNLSLSLIENCASNSAKEVGSSISGSTLIQPILSDINYCIKLSSSSFNFNYTLEIFSIKMENRFFSTQMNTQLVTNLMPQGMSGTLSAKNKTIPLHGTLTLDSNGDLAYTPKKDFTGTDSFVYTLSDDKGHTGEANVVIEVSNKHPLANDKNFGISVGTTLSKNAMNDGGLIDSDPSGGNISIFENTKPKNGTLVIEENGNFAYTPNLTFVGEDTFTYTIINDKKLTDTATITIKVLDVGDEFVPTSDTANVGVVCGTFEDVLQTHKHESIIIADGDASIIDGDCTLNTATFIDSQGTGKRLNCKKGFASGSGIESSALSIQYTNPPDTSAVKFSENNSTTNYTVVGDNGSFILEEAMYKDVEITSDGRNNGAKLFFKNTKNSGGLKINSLKLSAPNNTARFQNLTPYTLETPLIYGHDNSTIKTKTIPKNIKVGDITLAGGAKVDFEAKQTIQMNKAQFARDDSSINLKAQYIKIGHLRQDQSGKNGRSYVTLIADYIDIGHLDLSELATITIKPYTKGKRILFRSNKITASSSNTMIVSSGNYYTKEFNIPGTSDSSSIRALDKDQLINLFIDGDFKPGNNPGINSDGNKGNYGTLPAANFLMFVNGDFDIGSGGTTFNATIYVEGDAKIGTETAIKGAISAGGNINIGNNSQYVYDQTISESGWAECTLQPEDPIIILASLDAIDSFADGYTAGKGLKTKIANKDGYTVDVLYLGEGTTPTSYTGSKPLFVLLSLSNPSSILSTATIAPSAKKGTSESFKMPNIAKKEARLRFNYLHFDNLPGGDYSSCINSSNQSNFKGVPACFNSYNKIEQAFDTNIATACAKTGAKPACSPSSYANTLPTAPYDNEFGCFICLSTELNGEKLSSDTFAIRPESFDSTLSTNQQLIADKNSSITFFANQYNAIGTLDYNETENISFIVDINISDTSKTCTDNSIKFSPNIVFVDGNVTHTYNLPNVGDYNLTIYEKPGSEFALTDIDDTLDAERYITMYEKQIKVVPDHFLIEGSFQNGNGSFSYLSDFQTFPTPQDRNVSALLDLNITAQSALNNPTSNYTATCYAKDGNITLFTNTIGANLVGLNNLIYIDTNHLDTNGSKQLLNDTKYTIDMNASQFDSTTTDGMAEVEYRINFDRQANLAIMPFHFHITDLNVTNDDNRTSVLSLEQNATFYYTKAYAPDQTFNTQNANATFYYEVYCEDCNLTTRQNFGINGANSVDNIGWYQNSLHVNIDFGSFIRTNPIVSPTPLSGTTIGASTLYTLALTAPQMPHVDKITYTPPLWLVFNEFNAAATTHDFIVEFRATGNWGGEGSVDATDDHTTGLVIHQNGIGAAPSVQQRIEW